MPVIVSVPLESVYEVAAKAVPPEKEDSQRRRERVINERRYFFICLLVFSSSVFGVCYQSKKTINESNNFCVAGVCV